MHEEIGTAAGTIWDALNKRGEQSLGELKKAVKGKAPRTGSRCERDDLN